MNKKNRLNTTGLGVGYVSVMIIFAIICMTIFAVLSFSAASSTDGFNERSGEYLKQYYQADGAAKHRLAVLDAIARSSVESGFFEDEFEAAVAADTTMEGMDGITISRVQGGFSAGWTEKINDRQELSVSVRFAEDGEYEITRWQSRTIASEETESTLGVWTGSF